MRRVRPSTKLVVPVVSVVLAALFTLFPIEQPSSSMSLPSTVPLTTSMLVPQPSTPVPTTQPPLTQQTTSPPLRLASVGSSTRLAPLPSSPVASLHGDAGLLVSLHDGRVLWVNADSYTDAPQGGTGDFVTSLAAFATVETPEVLFPVLSDTGHLAPLIEPHPDEQAHGFPYIGLWPTSAVSLNDHTVAVFYDRMDVISPSRFDRIDTELALVDIPEPNATNHPAKLVSRRVSGPFTPKGVRVGDSSFVSDGYFYSYGCTNDHKWGAPGASCLLGRVPVDVLENQDLWEFYSGTGFEASPAHATSISTPGLPGVSASVGWSEIWHRWVMSFTSWPGTGHTVRVSFADSPSGPWSPYQDVVLPGCEPPVVCYTAFMHMELARGDAQAVSYFSSAAPPGLRLAWLAPTPQTPVS